MRDVAAFDPVRQVEYYGLASALSGVRHGERDLAFQIKMFLAAKFEAACKPVRCAADGRSGVASCRG